MPTDEQRFRTSYVNPAKKKKPTSRFDVLAENEAKGEAQSRAMEQRLALQPEQSTMYGTDDVSAIHGPPTRSQSMKDMWNESLANRQRTALSQQELISRLQTGTITPEERRSWAAAIRMANREDAIGARLGWTAPPVRSSDENAARARDFDNYLLRSIDEQAAPIREKLRAGQPLTPEESSLLQHYSNVSDRLIERSSPLRTETPTGYTIDYSGPTQGDEYYAERGRQMTAGQIRAHENFQQARDRDAMLYGEVLARRSADKRFAQEYEAAVRDAAIAEQRRSMEEWDQQRRLNEANIGAVSAETEAKIAESKKKAQEIERPKPAEQAQQELEERAASAIISNFDEDRRTSAVESAQSLKGVMSATTRGIVSGSFLTTDTTEGMRVLNDLALDIAALEKSTDSRKSEWAAQILNALPPPSKDGTYIPEGRVSPLDVATYIRMGIMPWDWSAWAHVVARAARGDLKSLADAMNTIRAKLQVIAQGQ